MMDDDKQIRPHAETPDFPVERTQLPEWRQVAADDDQTRPAPTDDTRVGGPGSGSYSASRSAGASGRADSGAADTSASDAGSQGDGSDQPPVQPQRIPAPTGPAWGTLAFGIVCLAVAAGALALQFVDVTVDWRYAAPLAFAGVGALLVVVGLIGLASRRTRE